MDENVTYQSSLYKMKNLKIDIEKATLAEIVNGIEQQSWHNHPRVRYAKLHAEGKRDEVPLCKECEFYGVPTGRMPTQKEKKYDTPKHAQRATARPVRKDARKGRREWH